MASERHDLIMNLYAAGIIEASTSCSAVVRHVSSSVNPAAVGGRVVVVLSKVGHTVVGRIVGTLVGALSKHLVSHSNAEFPHGEASFIVVPRLTFHFKCAGTVVKKYPHVPTFVGSVASCSKHAK
jgi:hypothetical protein